MPVPVPYFTTECPTLLAAPHQDHGGYAGQTHLAARLNPHFDKFLHGLKLVPRAQLKTHVARGFSYFHSLLAVPIWSVHRRNARSLKCVPRPTRYLTPCENLIFF